MFAYVITCNDSQEHIVLGVEGEALTKLKELKAEHREREITNKIGRPTLPSTIHMEESDRYEHIFNWRMTPLPLTYNPEILKGFLYDAALSA